MSGSKPRRVRAGLTRLAPWCLLIAILPAVASPPPDNHPDGAPTTVRNADGEVLTRWEQVGVTPEGCAAYQQVPVDSGIAVTQVLHYWTGDGFRMTPAGCLPLPR